MTGQPILKRLAVRTPLLAALLLGAALPASVLAGDWAEVGDKQLREDVELLHDAGIVQGPMLSWPLPWDQIAADVAQASVADDISPFLRTAAQRVAARMGQRQSDGPRPDVEIKVRAANGDAIVRDFSDASRSDLDASVRFEHTFDNLTLVYGAGYQDNQTFQGQRFGGKLVFDNVYVTQKLGNWLLYAGTVEQWWGPSGEQSLMMSNSARPYPKIGIKRISTDPFDTRWLRWLGPWRLEVNIGVQDGPRRDYQNVILLSQRIEVAPFKGFQLGIARFAQLCGKNNPLGLPDRTCSLGQIAKAVVLTGSANSGSVATDSSNSGAEISMRYARPVGDVVLSGFVHLYAEDSAFTAISQMAGVAVTGHSEKLGLWKIGAEAMDTYAMRTTDFAFGTRSPSVTYLNFVYTDGYSYRGRPMAASVDGDSRLYSLFGSITTRRNWRLSGALRYADINLFNDAQYRITNTREKIWIGEAGLCVPTRLGDMDAKLRYQSDSPDTPGRRKSRVLFEAGWTVRF